MPVGREASGVLGHALQHECVQAITRPLVPRSQGLDHHERLVEMLRPLERTVEGEVPLRPA